MHVSMNNNDIVGVSRPVIVIDGIKNSVSMEGMFIADRDEARRESLSLLLYPPRSWWRQALVAVARLCLRWAKDV